MAAFVIFTLIVGVALGVWGLSLMDFEPTLKRWAGMTVFAVGITLISVAIKIVLGVQ